MLTLKDYEDAAARYVAAVQELGPSVRSVLLYGSLARGCVHPGKSDLLDAVIIVTADTFVDEAQHRAIVKAIVAQTREIEKQGFPHAHCAHYVADDELRYLWPTGAAQYIDPGTSRLAAGADLSSEIREALKSKDAAGSFFMMRKTLLNWAAGVLGQPAPSAEDCIQAVRICAFWLGKAMPDYALNEIGEAPRASERWQVLGERLPGLDVDRAVRLEAILGEVHRRDDGEIDPEEALRLVRESFEVIEEIHDLLVEKLRPSLARGAGSAEAGG